MARFGILFDANKLGGHLYSYSALRTFFTLFDARRLAGCTLLGGGLRIPGARTKVYCLAVDAPDPGVLRQPRLTVAGPPLRGPFPPADRVLEGAGLQRQHPTGPAPLTTRRP